MTPLKECIGWSYIVQQARRIKTKQRERKRKIEMKYSWVRVLVLVACLLPALVECRVRQYTFNVSILLIVEEHMPS